jgi:hypothetical protein
VAGINLGGLGSLPSERDGGERAGSEGLSEILYAPDVSHYTFIRSTRL